MSDFKDVRVEEAVAEAIESDDSLAGRLRKTLNRKIF
jgi:hypothetical protein